MHLGNLFCALLSWLSVKSKGGEWLLRIEDLDPGRSRPEYARWVMDDLNWLGLDWDVRAEDQSRRGEAYEAALDVLRGLDLLYPCYCTRDQLHAASARIPQHASGVRAASEALVFGGDVSGDEDGFGVAVAEGFEFLEFLEEDGVEFLEGDFAADVQHGQHGFNAE